MRRLAKRVTSIRARPGREQDIEKVESVGIAGHRFHQSRNFGVFRSHARVRDLSTEEALIKQGGAVGR